MDKQQHFRPQKNSPPPPYDSPISSFSPSSLSHHDQEGPEHSLHPSPTPQQESSRKHPTKTRSDDELLKMVKLWFRVFGFLFCLISFSIMAADRNKGWTLDSFDRYIEFRYVSDLLGNLIGWFDGKNSIYVRLLPIHEFGSKETKKIVSTFGSTNRKLQYPILKNCNSTINIYGAAACRYCLTVNVIGFIYSALQGTDLAYQLFSSGGELLVSASHFRNIIDFASDQVPLLFLFFVILHYSTWIHIIFFCEF